MIAAMTRSPALLALALALVGCAPAPSPASDAGADAAVSPLVGRWVAESGRITPPTTWELSIDSALVATLTTTMSEYCGGDSVSRAVFVLRPVDVGVYSVTEREPCAGRTAACVRGPDRVCTVSALIISSATMRLPIEPYAGEFGLIAGDGSTVTFRRVP